MVAQISAALVSKRSPPEAAGTIAEISAAKFSMMPRLSIALAEKEHGFSVQRCKSVLARCSQIEQLVAFNTGERAHPAIGTEVLRYQVETQAVAAVYCP